MTDEKAYVHHQTRVHEDGEWFQSYCTCGWVGSIFYRTRRRAIARGAEHRRGGDVAKMEKERGK